ncbi:MAG: hypothetical protein ACRDJU_06240 [Actinomycetota bacterium]
MPARSRLWCALIGLALAAVAAVFLWGVVSPGTALRKTEIALGLLVMATAAVSALRLALLRRPLLEVSGGELVIRHPGLFRRPVTVPASEVRAVLVSDAVIRRGLLQTVLPAQFSLEPDGAEPVSVYPGGRRFVPALGFFQQSVNLCLLFRSPVALSGVRRLPALFLDNRALLRLRTVPGLCLPLESPLAAQQALADLGVEGSMPQAELEAMLPRLERRDWLGR